MFAKVVTRAAVIAASLILGAGASADTTVSQSNDPAVQLDSELSRLFAKERDVMQEAAPASAERILSAYKPQPRPDDVPVRVQYSKEFLSTVPKASGDEQWECLSQALYFEARGESVKGQFAVAEVILNRVNSSAFPDTICGVVNQGTGKKYQCQFTYTCDGHKEVIAEPRAWTRVGKIARLMIDGAPLSLTAGATHYHTRAVSPRWSRQFARTATIGVHYFYRMPRA